MISIHAPQVTTVDATELEPGDIFVAGEPLTPGKMYIWTDLEMSVNLVTGDLQCTVGLVHKLGGGILKYEAEFAEDEESHVGAGTVGEVDSMSSA